MLKGFKLGLIAVVAIAVSLLIGTAIASADAGIHANSGFTSTVDECAACHRVHSAEGDNLLNNSGNQYDFCTTCHGAGVGSDLDVVNGMDTSAIDQPLMGGGFEFARMDVGLDGTLDVSTAVSSTHSVNMDSGSETSAILWGNGDADQVGTSITLTCGSCHNPHGNGNYRILREAPIQGDNSDASVTLTDEGTPDYIRTYTTGSGNGWGGTGDVTFPDTNTFTNTSEWCSQCHTKYEAASAAGSGDSVYAYSHTTISGGSIECDDCHVAHGSSSSMGSYSSAVTYPDGATGEAGISQSGRLLWADNRGVCTQCHTTGL